MNTIIPFIIPLLWTITFALPCYMSLKLTWQTINVQEVWWSKLLMAAGTVTIWILSTWYLTILYHEMSLW